MRNPSTGLSAGLLARFGPTHQRGFDLIPQLQGIRATFDRRKTALPTASPLAFTVEFTEDDQKLKQWNAFVRKGKLDTVGLSLSGIAKTLEAFLIPPTTTIAHGKKFHGRWRPGGPWTT